MENKNSRPWEWMKAFTGWGKPFVPPGKWPQRTVTLEIPPMPMQGREVKPLDAAWALAMYNVGTNLMGKYVNLRYAIKEMFMKRNAEVKENQYEIRVNDETRPPQSPSDEVYYILITIDATRKDKLVCELADGDTKEVYRPLRWMYVPCIMYEGHYMNEGHFVHYDDLSELLRMKYRDLLLGAIKGKIKPGTGTIGPKGKALLIAYEDMGESYKVYEGGQLTAILSRDVEGYGNITYGYGTLFFNTPEDKKRLKEVYGLEFAERVSVPIAICEQMYQDYINKNLAGLHRFTDDNDIWLTQNQIDALIMHRYLRSTLGKKTQELLIEMFTGRDLSDSDLKLLYRDKLFDAMLGDLSTSKDFERFKNGWTNRILDELELFFDGDEKRNH